jgi:hypothetical protein
MRSVQLDFTDSPSSPDLALYLRKWVSPIPISKTSRDIKI